MKNLLKKGLVAAACTVTMLAGFGTANATDYEYIDLFTSSSQLDGFVYELGRGQYENKAMAINDSGTVVGWLKGQWNGRSQMHVVSWDLTDGGAATDLGLMGSSKNNAMAYGLSETGQIAGTYRTKVGSSQVYKPYTYDLNTGIQTNLVTVITDPTAVALDINDSGVAVGWVSTKLTTFLDSAPKRAYISNADGTISYIAEAYVGTEYGENLPGSSANSINNAGLVTGYTTVDGNWQAFLYNSGTEDFTTLGTLGGLISVGNAINECGAIVGYSTLADGTERAFLYSEGTMIDLGSMGDVATGAVSSRAYAINDAGDVVGTADGHAVLYSNGRMIDLNDYVDPSLGITLTMATGINNLGQIVGYGYSEYYSEEMNHLFIEEKAFALNPITPTPIPASLLLFCSGLAGLGVFRRRVWA